MDMLKTASLRRIEEKMEDMDEKTLRYQVLQAARDFKASWIKLGQALYSVCTDKLYKEWGYQTFEGYTLKEIGIKKPTAMKLLNSYYFLEKEEPAYLQSYKEPQEVKLVPSYEAVSVLRLAKKKKELDESDYTNLKKDVFENGKEAVQIKRDLTALIKKRKDVDPEEEKKKFTIVSIKRCVTTLRTLKRDIDILKILPAKFAADIDNLIRQIEEQIV